MLRKRASIVARENLHLIHGADQIEVATVKGWKVVVKKTRDYDLPEILDDVLAFAEGVSRVWHIGKQVSREGVVFRKCRPNCFI